jgi:hypothetical protein
MGWRLLGIGDVVLEGGMRLYTGASLVLLDFQSGLPERLPERFATRHLEKHAVVLKAASWRPVVLAGVASRGRPFQPHPALALSRVDAHFAPYCSVAQLLYLMNVAACLTGNMTQLGPH